MAAGIPFVTLWTDLAPAGGTILGAVKDWTDGQTTLQEDGDDRLSLQLAMADPMAASCTPGRVLRCTYDDGEVEEWIIQRRTQRWPEDLLTIEALPPRVWLAERLPLYDTTGAGSSTVTYTGTPTAILTTLQGEPGWPAWLVTGTIDLTASVTISVTASNGLAALLALRDAANALRDLDDDPAVLRVRRVDDTEYAIDLTTAVTAGAYLTPQKNLLRLSTLDDRTQQQTEVLVAGENGVLASEAYFRVRYEAGTSPNELGIEAVDGHNTIVTADDQYNGLYLVDGAGVVHEILDTEVASPVSKVFVAGAVTAPCVARFARNSAGDPLFAIPSTSSEPRRVGWLANTAFGRRVNWAFVPAMDQWDAGVLRGHTLSAQSGAPTFSEETTIRETGTSALRCTTSDTSGTAQTGQVVSSTGGQFVGTLRAGTWVVGMRLYSEASASLARAAQVSSVRANSVGQTLSNVVNANWSLATSGWATATAEFTLTGTADTTIEWTMLLALGASNVANTRTIVLDRVWLFRKGVDDEEDTLVGSEMMDLFLGGQRVTSLTGGAAPRTYQIDVADRYRDDPTAFPDDALRPMTTARIVLPAWGLDTTQRVVQVVRSLRQPLTTQLQVGALRRRLTTTL